MDIPVKTSGKAVTVDICMPSNELEKNVDFSVFRRSDSGCTVHVYTEISEKSILN